MPSLYYTEKTPKIFKVTQWFKLGDHPKVKVNPGSKFGYINSKDGPRTVRPGEFIMDISSGKFKVFQKEDLNSRFDLVNKLESTNDRTDPV